MTREKFFKSVLTDAEYTSIGKAFDGFEERANDLVSEIRDEIEKIMERLYAVKNSTEFVGNNFTLINRQGEIGVIEHSDVMEGGGEISLDNIVSLDKLMDILSEFV
jgi:tetrahydromethanopterin S-methyltransferase subunit G